MEKPGPQAQRRVRRTTRLSRDETRSRLSLFLLGLGKLWDDFHTLYIIFRQDEKAVVGMGRLHLVSTAGGPLRATAARIKR
jgi:hypothetical protein